LGHHEECLLLRSTMHQHVCQFKLRKFMRPMPVQAATSACVAVQTVTPGQNALAACQCC
jgi:hypothetical protein